MPPGQRKTDRSPRGSRVRRSPLRNRSRKPGAALALRRNFGWKLGSLLLAVLLWFAILGEPELVTTHTVPDPLQQSAAGSADWRGRGRPGAPRVARASEPAERPPIWPTNRVVLDLSGERRAGRTHVHAFRQANLHLPQGVTFLRAVPSQLAACNWRGAKPGGAGRRANSGRRRPPGIGWRGRR